MPNRDLKETNRRSPSLQLLSDAAERLWYRLITAVDDFGRLEADHEVVFTTCFQRVPKGWTVQKVSMALEELSIKAHPGDRPLIAIYQVGTRSFLQILSAPNYIQCRSKRSKYPPQENQLLTPDCLNLPTDAGRGGQMPADSLVSRIPYPESRIPYPESRIPYPVSRIPNFIKERKKGKEEEEAPTPTQALDSGKFEPMPPALDACHAQAQVVDKLEHFHLTPELEAWSAKEGIPTPGQYVEEFKDYWRSTGGKRKNGQSVKNWPAVFRNHLRHLKATKKLKQPDWKEAWVKEGGAA